MNRLLKHAATLAAVVALNGASVFAADVVANYEVIPLPQKVMPGRSKPFVLDKKTVIAVPKGSKELKSNAALLA